MATGQPTEKIVLEEHIRGRVSVYLAPGVVPGLKLDALFDLPAILAGLEGRSTRIAGRPTSWHWQPAWGPEAGYHVRQYAHGGALGRMLGTVFPSEKRMLDELRLTAYAHAQEVPTGRPIGVRIERVYGPLVRAHYLCETVPGAVNLLDFCRNESTDSHMRPKPRADLTEAVALAVAAVHDADILHADLNLKNILIHTAGWPARAFVIDFDKSEHLPALSSAQRMANLRRLERSFLKWQSSQPFARLQDRIRFLREYARACAAPLTPRELLAARCLAKTSTGGL